MPCVFCVYDMGQCLDYRCQRRKSPVAVQEHDRIAYSSNVWFKEGEDGRQMLELHCMPLSLVFSVRSVSINSIR